METPLKFWRAMNLHKIVIQDWRFQAKITLLINEAYNAFSFTATLCLTSSQISVNSPTTPSQVQVFTVQ